MANRVLNLTLAGAYMGSVYRGTAAATGGLQLILIASDDQYGLISRSEMDENFFFKDMPMAQFIAK